MSEHTVTIDWKRETPDFGYQSYNRDHDWVFDAGITVRASADPAYLGRESCVDPEEAFVASLSSCHMLTFLAIACKKRFTVDGYRDQAVGILGKDEAGRFGHDQSHSAPASQVRGREDTDAGGTGAAAPSGPPRLLHSQLGEDRGRCGVSVMCPDARSRTRLMRQE